MTKQVWIKFQEALQLLGIQKDSLRKACNNGLYQSKEGKTKGKKDLLILLSSLPEHAQEKYFHQVFLDNQKASDDPSLDLYNKAPYWAKKKADKYMRLLNETKGLKGQALKNYISDWNTRNHENKTSYASLMRAKKDYQKYGLSGLLAQYGQNKGKNKVDDRCFEYFKSLYLLEGSPSGYSCWLMTLGYAKETLGMDIADFPSLSSFKRRLSKELPQQTIYIARHGEAAWNRKFGMYIDRDYSEVQVGSLWVSDHAQVDVAVFDEAGRVVFPWVTAWRDFKSSKWLGWLLHMEAPNSDHIFQSFYYAVLDFGLPEDVYIDNGKDYRAKDFAGGRSKNAFKLEINENKASSMLSLLNIKPHFALPYNAQTKPIERDFLKNKELLSKHIVGYRGGNVVERPEKLKKEINAKNLLSFTDFKRIFDDFILNVLNKHPSDGKILNGHSPDEFFSAEFTVKRTVSKDALALFCMRTSKALTIGRNGVKDSELGVTYWAEWMSPLKGEKVYLRRDINAYQEAWIFSLQDEYLGKAQIAELIPALAQTEIQKAELKEAMAQKKRDKKVAKSYLENLQKVDSFEKLQHLKAGVQAVSNQGLDPNPKVITIPNTSMDKVIQKNKEMDSIGTADYSSWIPETPQRETIYLFETDKYFDELSKKKKAEKEAL